MRACEETINISKGAGCGEEYIRARKQIRCAAIFAVADTDTQRLVCLDYWHWWVWIGVVPSIKSTGRFQQPRSGYPVSPQTNSFPNHIVSQLLILPPPPASLHHQSCIGPDAETSLLPLPPPGPGQLALSLPPPSSSEAANQKEDTRCIGFTLGPARPKRPHAGSRLHTLALSISVGASHVPAQGSGSG